MTYDEFRLLERHQRLDEHLDLAKSRAVPDLFEVRLLKSMKQVLRQRLVGLRRRPAR